MAVSGRSPDRIHFGAFWKIFGERSCPILIAYRTGVGSTGGHGLQYLDLTRAGIAVLADVEIKAGQLKIFVRIDLILFQKIPRKDCGLRRIVASQGESLILEIPNTLNAATFPAIMVVVNPTSVSRMASTPHLPPVLR